MNQTGLSPNNKQVSDFISAMLSGLAVYALRALVVGILLFIVFN